MSRVPWHSPCYGQGNESLSVWLKGTQLLRDRSGIRTWTCLIPSHILFSPIPWLLQAQLLPEAKSPLRVSMTRKERAAYTASLSPSTIMAAFQGANSPSRTAWYTGKKLTHCVDIQRIHSEVIGVHVQAIKHLPQGDLPALLLGHNSVRFRLVRVLDEAQQVLLVHTGSCMDVRVHLQHSTHQPVSPATSTGDRMPTPQCGEQSLSTFRAMEAAPTNAWIPPPNFPSRL